MKFQLYQIIIFLISAFMILQGIKNYIEGKNNQTFYKLCIRIFVWGGMAIVTLLPKLIQLLAKTLGIIDNMNAVILTGFLLIFLMIFKLLSAIERLEQSLSEVTRNETLGELEKNK
jgi:hypothetical protein